MKRTVVLRAPLLSLSGYGEHSRQIFRWLLKKDVNIVTHIVPWGVTSWHINPNDLNGLVGEIMQRSQAYNNTAGAGLSIQLQLPNEWDPNLTPRTVGMSAFVETDICNPAWIKNCNNMTHVVVPTHHTKQTIEKTGKVNRPLSVVPESFIDEVNLSSSPLSLNLETNFNFLMIGQMTGGNQFNDRKNTFNTLKWLCEEFSNDPDVGIIIKTNSGTGTSIDRKNTYAALRHMVENIRKGPYPRVYLLHGNMTSSEIASLYKRKDVKAFVSLTRGEGFGLPLLEAAASDLPVIATNWSGHLDFLNRGKFISVNYNLENVHESRIDNNIFVSGSKWAEPVEFDFKRKIRKFRENSDVPKQWARELGAVVRQEFSQDAIESAYDKAIGYLL